jgi:hypothetical protein
VMDGVQPVLGEAMIIIGVETAHCIAPPLPPNRTGGFPASGSPVSEWLVLETDS